MTGVGQGYEPPEHPDVTVDGDGDVDDAVDAAARRPRGAPLSPDAGRRDRFPTVAELVYPPVIGLARVVFAAQGLRFDLRATRTCRAAGVR